ncbi:hypothetical protein SCHPADRAFT_946453 [Schizopora paradoxa]|uniref:Uncharacterized protein n=1 Tax=Schizopora paradoxa TaxID=27342 RepID=A0A0H2R955_9AGAM|nr:hypothetical protein SCHPADRAFT_946453 [Schizopora paradoxa]
MPKAFRSFAENRLSVSLKWYKSLRLQSDPQHPQQPFQRPPIHRIINLHPTMQVFSIVVSLVLATLAVATPAPVPQLPTCVASGDVCILEHPEMCCTGSCLPGTDGGLDGTCAFL